MGMGQKDGLFLFPLLLFRVVGMERNSGAVTREANGIEKRKSIPTSQTL